MFRVFFNELRKQYIIYQNKNDPTDSFLIHKNNKSKEPIYSPLTTYYYIHRLIPIDYRKFPNVEYKVTIKLYIKLLISYLFNYIFITRFAPTFIISYTS
ncbi:hypothetical protein S101441_00233 [Bacillus subtilis subsp. subtilis]|nr:hypothetical protein S101441_00233 [Bacillus subtilis subsp. subtilis]